MRLEAESPQIRGLGRLVQGQAHLAKKHSLKQKDVLFNFNLHGHPTSFSSLM